MALQESPGKSNGLRRTWFFILPPALIYMMVLDRVSSVKRTHPLRFFYPDTHLDRPRAFSSGEVAPAAVFLNTRTV
jgi:hypothetical protein